LAFLAISCHAAPSGKNSTAPAKVLKVPAPREPSKPKRDAPAGNNPHNSLAGNNPHNSLAGNNPHNSPAGNNPHNSPAGNNPHNSPAGSNPDNSPVGNNPHNSPAAANHPYNTPIARAPVNSHAAAANKGSPTAANKTAQLLHRFARAANSSHHPRALHAIELDSDEKEEHRLPIKDENTEVSKKPETDKISGNSQTNHSSLSAENDEKSSEAKEPTSRPFFASIAHLFSADNSAAANKTETNHVGAGTTANGTVLSAASHSENTKFTPVAID